MTTSWKEICSKMKLSGMTGNSSKARGGSDDSVTSTSDFDTVTTNSSTPQFNNNNRASIDNEWQMNYMIINRKDGLPKVRKEKKQDDKKTGWNSGGKDVKPKVTSRIDTNMVKLKLLDATRKAIIEKQKKQLVSSFVQTDPVKTKLCKDQSTENQLDMIRPIDRGTDTEYEFLAHLAKDGTLIVTSTCSSNTDKVQIDSVSTQTVMPRSNVSFKRFLDSKHTVQYADDDEWTNEDESDDSITESPNNDKLLRPRKKLTKQRSAHKSRVNIFIEDSASSDMTAVEVITTDNEPDSTKIQNQKRPESEFEESIKDHQPDLIKGSIKLAKPTEYTFNSWQDLERKAEQPQSFLNISQDEPTPWSGFKDLVLGQRFLNARLSPTPKKQFQSHVKQETWSDSQVKIVSDLIKEANALMEMFDQVAMLLGPDIKLHNVSDLEDFELPPSKYSSELTMSCDKLEASLKRLQDIKPCYFLSTQTN